MRSFVRRDGRRLSEARRRALQKLWPAYGIDFRSQSLGLEEVFARRAPLVVEVGPGNGDATLRHAKHHPENNYLLLETDRSCVGQLLLVVARCGLCNVRVMNHDAVEVFAQQLPAASVDVVFIFFPDPWPKKRHHKRRLVQAGFLRHLVAVLKRNGQVFLATDWPDYARHIAAVFGADKQFLNLAGPSGLAPRPVWRAVTKYERRGRRLQHETYDFCYVSSSLS